ncbi:MAG: FAD-binding protein, partial [Rhodospirillaceae bacterium]|nr:FAD-binding protein [Rhodospirillaceae bacterium]
MQMPEPNAAVLARRAQIAADLRTLLPAPDQVIAEVDELRAYETDGLSAYRQMPMIVVLPETTAQVSAIMRYCYANGIRTVARGAGTSLAGGALPLADSVVIGISKMTRIVDVDFANRTATVQPGVTNMAITTAVQHEDFF